MKDKSRNINNLRNVLIAFKKEMKLCHMILLYIFDVYRHNIN